MASEVEIIFPDTPLGVRNSVATIAALRAEDSTDADDSTYILVKTGSFYVWDASSLAADNGTSVIKPDDLTALQAGRWLRVEIGFSSSVIQDTSATAFQIIQDDGTLTFNVSTLDTYSGVGTATSGAPRIYIGTQTPSGDDSAICIGRELIGNVLFSHAVRDESTFVSTGSSAYASFDANAVMSGSAAYNHFYGLQGRPNYSGTNTLSVLAGCVTAPIQNSGAVTTVAGLTCQNSQFLGGTRTNHYGVHVETLSAPSGGGTAFAFFSDNNDSALLGALLIQGRFRGTTHGRGGAWDATGTPEDFNTTGGVVMWGNSGGATYAGIRAYSDIAGTGKGLFLQDNGGQVLVGATTPATSAKLEVTGSTYATTWARVGSYTVAGLPSAATAGAGAMVYATNGRNAGEGAGVGTGSLVVSNGTIWRIPGIAAAVAA